jgi:hypothetical protein
MKRISKGADDIAQDFLRFFLIFTFGKIFPANISNKKAGFCPPLTNRR